MRKSSRYERPEIVDLTAKDWNVPVGIGQSVCNDGNGDISGNPSCSTGDKPGPYACLSGIGPH